MKSTNSTGPKCLYVSSTEFPLISAYEKKMSFLQESREPMEFVLAAVYIDGLHSTI